VSAELLPEAWSFSSLNTLLRICSLQWAAKAAGFEPESVAVATSLGQAVHNAHAYARALQKKGTAVALADLLDVFADSWECLTSDPRIAFESAAERESQRRVGVRVVETIFANLSQEQVLAIEEPFRLELKDEEGRLPRPLIGYLDLVVRDRATGAVSIVDLKTSARAWANTAGESPKVETDLQSVVYLAIGRERFGPEVRFRFEVVTKTAPAKFQRIAVEKTDADFKRLVKLIRVAERMVSAGAIYPQPGWACNGCGFKGLCASWHEGNGFLQPLARSVA
jgi:CRISPR/Cas system-associated exonuclease Cas4 (RecB family)